MPEPNCVTDNPVPEILPENVKVSERSKTSAPEPVTVPLELIVPLVAPAPTWSVPPAMLVLAVVFVPVRITVPPPGPLERVAAAPEIAEGTVKVVPVEASSVPLLCAQRDRAICIERE